jgi:mono/diheme cytochrome c family protein
MASAADAHAAALFSGACAGCHGWTGTSPVLTYASFTGARSVNDPSARNVAQAIVWGVNRQAPSGPINMPAFGNSYSDAEIAVLANYVTARFGAAASQIQAADVARIRREASQ